MVSPTLLRNYDEVEGWLVRPGVVDVMVGPSSDNLPLNGQFKITGKPIPSADPETFFSAVHIK